MSISQPLFSIIIPACDEEAYLPKCLEAVGRAIQFAREPAEVIVVDNLSHDRTVEIAREGGARVVEESRKCLSAVRNTGARAANGRYLVFVDADSVMGENMLAEIGAAMDSGRYVGGGVLNVRPDRYSLGIVMHFAVALPYALWIRTAVCLFYTSPEAFWAIGGFDESLYALEDVDFAQRLRRHGRRLGLKYKNLWKAQLVTSTRKFDEFGDWFIFRKPLTVWRAAHNDRKAADDIWYRRRR